MHFRVLGPVEIDVAGQPVVLPRRRERCLLAVLLLELDRVVTVDRLAELLWEGAPPDNARRTIHSHVSRVRGVLGRTAARVDLDTVGDGYRLRTDPTAVDAHQFRRLVERTGELSLVERVEQLRAALALWRGPALQDAASDWLRERCCADLMELRLKAAEDYFGGSLALGRERDALPALAAMAREHPGRERLAEYHMRALHRAGRRTDALGVYTQAREYLVDELGLEPGPALRELHQAVLRDEPSVAAPPATGAPLGPVALSQQPVPRQLPPTVSPFVGRREELRRLDAGRADDAPAARVMTIEGTAGVGKTALALHWAHRVADRFPDGQLYLDLRGFAPEGPPINSSEAVRGLLEALGVPPGQQPASTDARVGLYRSLLADRRALLVFDNARDCGQVRPLLPGSASCLTVVTSRHQMKGLVAAEGARPVPVELLTQEEAWALLAGRLGEDRLTADPVAAAEVITACARLPLALAIVSARAAAYPRSPLRVFADELESGLDALAHPDSAADLRAVFEWSYQDVGPDAGRMFQLLGQYGGEVTVVQAAKLAGVATGIARSLLAELARAHLLTEYEPGSYRCHPLLRAYAVELHRRA